MLSNKPFADEFQFVSQKMRVARTMDQAIHITGFVAYLGRDKTNANEATGMAHVDLPSLSDDSFYLSMTHSALRDCFGGERFWLYLMRPEMVPGEDYSDRQYNHGKFGQQMEEYIMEITARFPNLRTDSE